MNIVYISGSPRKGGNSDTLAKHFLTQCQRPGINVRTFNLNQLNYRGCQACDGCKKTAEHCILNDDLTPVLEAAFAADLLVLASPVYYGDISAQLKGFIDRTYSFLLPGYIAKKHPNRIAQRKSLVFVLAQGHRDPEMFADILPRYSAIFHWTGFAKTWPLRAVDVYHRNDIGTRADLFNAAKQLADQLIDEYNTQQITVS